MIVRNILHDIIKNVEPSVPGPRYKGLRIALSIEPSNAESPTMEYIITPHVDEVDIYIHPTGRSWLLCFD